jgi:hypothetical protein
VAIPLAERGERLHAALAFHRLYRAALTNLNAKAHDRIAVYPSNAFNRTDARAFGDYRDSLVGVEYVRHVYYCTTIIEFVKVFL